MATKITVNGVSYESVDAMPPEVRRLYDQAMANLPALTDVGAGGPNVKKDVRVFFHVSGPGFSFGSGSGTPSASPPPRAAMPISAPRPIDPARMSAPIEPASLGRGLLIALVLLGACLALGLIIGFLMRAH